MYFRTLCDLLGFDVSLHGRRAKNNGVSVSYFQLRSNFLKTHKLYFKEAKTNIIKIFYSNRGKKQKLYADNKVVKILSKSDEKEAGNSKHAKC